MFSDIFDYEYFVDGDENFIQFEDVTFIRDFGPWKSDEVVHTLEINFDNGIMTSYDIMGNKTDEVKIEIKVKL